MKSPPPVLVAVAALGALACTDHQDLTSVHAAGAQDAAASDVSEVGVGSTAVTLVAQSRTGTVWERPLPWVGFRDGEDGPWQLVPREAGRYAFQATTGRYTLVFVCGTFVRVIQAAVAELSHIAANDCFWDNSVPKYALSGGVRGFAGDRGWVDFVSSGGFGRGDIKDRRYTVEIPRGTYEVAALEIVDPVTIGVTGTRLLRLQSFTFDGSGELDLDFAGATTFVRRPLPLDGLRPGETVQASVQLRSPGGLDLTVGHIDRAGTHIGALRSADLRPGDQQVLFVSTGGVFPVRGTTLLVEGDELPPVVLPPAFVSQVVSPKAERLRATVSFQPFPGASYYELKPIVPWRGTGFSWLVQVSVGWLSGRTSFELPDLSNAPGFESTWLPDPNTDLHIVRALATDVDLERLLACTLWNPTVSGLRYSEEIHAPRATVGP
jgi:hypothetical protein